MVVSAPRLAHNFALSAPPAMAMTRAPAATPNWMIDVPTPLAPPATSSGSPAWRRARVCRARALGGGEGMLAPAAERLLGAPHDPPTEPVAETLAGLVHHAAHVHA